MSKFYQPKRTQGIFDGGDNRLTVNQDDRVLIGFRADSKKELDDTSVDTDVLDLARYSINSFTVEIDIDTSEATTFKVRATKKDPAVWGPRRDICTPLEIEIRRRKWLTPPAVGQEKDPSACWAACLAFYLAATPDRQPRRFLSIVGDFSGLWDSHGFIKVDGLIHQIAKQHSLYRMATEQISPKRLVDFVGRWPLVVGYRSPSSGFGHMNVLTAYDELNDRARAMDPWSPDPPANCLTTVYGQIVFNGNEGDFKFTGGFLQRPLSYFQSPMRSGLIFVGYPEEYRKRMP